MRVLLGAALAVVAGAALAADVPEDARRKKGEVLVLSRTPVDDPAEALFAAAELARAGGGFFDSLFARGLATDPAVRAATAEGAERAARAVLSRYVLRGNGLPLHSSSYARKDYERLKAAGAAGIGTTPRELVDQRIRIFARAAGLREIPKGLSPVYAEAALREGLGGRKGASPVIDSAALGFGLLAEARLAGRLAGVRRADASGELKAGGPIGESPEAGFEGLLLLYCAEAKLHSLRTLFPSDGAAFAPATLVDYDPFTAPRYYPRALLVRDPGEAGDPALDVAEKPGRLADAAAMLLGAAELARLADPARSPDTAPLFGALRAGDVKEEIFPVALAALAKDMVRFFFRNLAALHFDPAPERLVFMAEAFPGGRGTRMASADAALAILALEAATETFPDDQRLRAEAKKLVKSQAEVFLAAPPEGLAASLDFGAAKAPPVAPELAGEFLEVEALLAAARVTGEERFAEGARKLARALERRRFDPWADLYLGEPQGSDGSFTLGPRDGPAMLGTLRELAAAGPAAAEAVNRFRGVYAALAKAGALPREDGECAAVKLRVKR